ncbi:MAG: ABC transporter permease, partial [Gammaproteobacteria bacterium]
MPNLKTIAQTAGLMVLIILGIALWMAVPLLMLGVGLGLTAWLWLSRGGRQTLAITWTGLSTLPQRLGATSVIVVGIAGVVGVLIALLAMAAGFEATLKQAGSTDTAIVLRAGADAELS